MKGILLVSHGDLAKGMMDTLSLFFGDLDHVDYLCLKKEDNPDQFKEIMREKVKMLDDGEGVYIIGDIIGGTPLNQAAYLMQQDIKIIGGMNLAMLLELLTKRYNHDIDHQDIMSVAKNSIQCLNDLWEVKA